MLFYIKSRTKMRLTYPQFFLNLVFVVVTYVLICQKPNIQTEKHVCNLMISVLAFLTVGSLQGHLAVQTPGFRHPSLSEDICAAVFIKSP